MASHQYNLNIVRFLPTGELLHNNGEKVHGMYEYDWRWWIWNEKAHISRQYEPLEDEDVPPAVQMAYMLVKDLS